MVGLAVSAAVGLMAAVPLADLVEPPVPLADSAVAARMAWHAVLDQAKIALLVGSDAGVAEAVELFLTWEQDREVMRRKPRITTSAMVEILVDREEISLVSSQVVAFSVFSC